MCDLSQELVVMEMSVAFMVLLCLALVCINDCMCAAFSHHQVRVIMIALASLRATVICHR